MESQSFMKTNFTEILNELSYRVSSGIPDLTNEQHLMRLWDILKEHNWNIDARVELLKNLDEQDTPSVQSILNRSFKNAQSGRMIKVSSALGYKNNPKGQAAYGVAKGMMSDAGFGDEAEKIANKKSGEEKPQEREPQDENTPEQNNQSMWPRYAKPLVGLFTLFNMVEVHSQESVLAALRNDICNDWIMRTLSPRRTPNTSQKNNTCHARLIA